MVGDTYFQVGDEPRRQLGPADRDRGTTNAEPFGPTRIERTRASPARPSAECYGPRMLLSPDEMRFDFGGRKLDPKADRDVLAWAMQQFLYGEVTGIQIGHWLFRAPDIDAARFLSKQAIEEFQHVGNFVRILEILGVEPAPAHPIVRFLSTGMMGQSWDEHVALEMALGEGLVLQAFYALIELVDEPEIVAILKRGVRQEETHVDFGERRTMALVRENPALRSHLLGLALTQLFAVRRLADYMEKALPKTHPVLAQLPAFVEHVVRCSELRLLRIGLTTRPLARMSAVEKLALVAKAYARKAIALPIAPFREPKKLTDTYLDDPAVRSPTIYAAHRGDEHALN